jgi:hypothetical protein
VFAKRLLRLLLAPGLVSYALLIAVIALIWLGVGRTPAEGSGARGLTPTTSSTDPASAITYHGEPDPSASPISLNQAMGNARRFAGEPDLELEGSLQSDPSRQRFADFYYLESAGSSRGEDFIKVDARTGEVVEATFRSRIEPSGPPIGLGLTEAEQAAARYAHDRFYGFDTLELVDRSSRASAGNMVHSFKWSQVAADSGAELPVSVSVAMSAGSGEVVWYLAQRDQILVDVRPTVDRAQAIQTAASAVRVRDARWDNANPAAVRLQVLYDDENQQQLVWSVTFNARQPSSRPTIRLLVDAHSGRLIANSA